MINPNARTARKLIGDQTRTLILDTAERICAEKGFESLSVRAISELAGVNLNAVTYHFGGKHRLFEEMFKRRVVPLNEERLALLDAAFSKQTPPTLDDVLYAFIRPPMRLSVPADTETGNSAIVVMQFLSRAFSMPGEEQFLGKYYEPVRSRFLVALKHFLPEVPLEDILWRYNLMVGAIIYAMGGMERMERLPRAFATTQIQYDNDLEVLVQRFVNFFSAGFHAS